MDTFLGICDTCQFLFSPAFCARPLRQRPSACADARSTFSQSGVRLNFWTHVDGEDLMEKSVGGNLVNGYLRLDTAIFALWP